jgi:FkbM family methyltransferase
MAPKAPRPAWETELVWLFFDRRKEGCFVEVGANEPKAGSQTWFLEERGWRGLLIEPQARLAEKLRQERPRSTVVQAACGAPGHPDELPFYIGEGHGHSSLGRNLVDADTKYVRTEQVKVFTLDEILARADTPKVDFVSIDVEGTQLDVLRGFSLEAHRPALVLLEDHLHTLQVHRHFRGRGYRLVKRTEYNNWYVPQDRPFTLSTPLERLRLWKKVWANTPFRKLRVYRERKRAQRQSSSPP